MTKRPKKTPAPDGWYEASRKPEYDPQDDLYWNFIEPMTRAVEQKRDLSLIWTRFQGRNVLCCCFATVIDSLEPPSTILEVGDARPMPQLDWTGGIMDPRFQCGDPVLEAEFEADSEKKRKELGERVAYHNRMSGLIDRFNAR